MMVKAQEQEYSNFNEEKLIELIRKNAAHIIPLLKQDIASLPLSSLHQLHQISELEASAKKLCGSYAVELTKYSVKAFELIQSNLSELKLSKEELKIVNDIYKQTILIGVKKASEKLLTPLSQNKGYLYNKILSEQTVNVLSSILEFKKSIDQHFPGLSDKIIAAAVPAITTLVATYAPPIGLALKATGILSKAAEYIKTDNLEKTVQQMRNDLDKIEQTKHLAEAQELGTKLSELAKIVDISAESLQKSGVTLSNIKEITQEISNNQEAAAFLKEVCKYTEKHIPNSKHEVEELFKNIKQDAIKQLKENGVSQETIDDFQKMYEEESIHAELQMKDTTKPVKTAFDKITTLQKSADLMDKAQAKITRTLAKKYPDDKASIQVATKSIDNNVKAKIRGDLNGIASKMTSNTKAKNLAKKYLGAGLASEVTIKNSLSKHQTRSKAR